MMQSSPTFADLRRAAGLSQARLGQLIAEPGNDTSYYQPRIQSYESGRKRIPEDVAKAIVKVLNKHLREKKSTLIARPEDLIHARHRQGND